MTGGDPALTWDCGDCREQGLSTYRGCDGPADPDFIHVTRNGLKFKKCPKAWLRTAGRKSSTLIGDAWRYKDCGILPRSGGWEDQAAEFVDAATLVDVELEKVTNGKTG